MTVALPLLTASRLKDFRRCARLHHYRYQVGMRPIATVAELRFGSLIHAGLQRWWECLLPEAVRDQVVTMLDDLVFERQPTAAELDLRDALATGDQLVAALAAVAGRAADPFEQARVDEMLRGYHFRWLDAGLEPIAVEVQFTAPLVNPATGKASITYAIGGKLDVLARDQAGRIIIIEHKTSAEDISPGSTYWLRLRMDGQISQYFAGARALGHEPAACLYDVLLKPRFEPKEAMPVDKRLTTMAKFRACPECKRKNGAPAPHANPIDWSTPGATMECGTGATVYMADGLGVVVPGEPGKVLSDPPRYMANVRIADETPDEYRVRIVEAIAGEPEKYFVRGEVVRLEADEREHAQDAWQTGKAMREAELAGRAPRNPDSCVLYGRACAYFDVCTGAASIDDTTRFERIENINPELAGAAG